MIKNITDSCNELHSSDITKKRTKNLSYDFFPDKKLLYTLTKRIYDIIVSFILIILLLFPMIILGLIIKFTSQGPAIYKSIRVGKGEKKFKMYKFRSMCFDADKKLADLKDKNEVSGGIIFKIKDDPRTTRFGKFLRRTSLDELPQLFNVIKGDMSLIGPRAALPSEVEKYDARAIKRLLVPQGISGEWQTHGRSDTSFSEMIDNDLEYIYKKRGFFYDLKLTFLTVFVILKKDGAK